MYRIKSSVHGGIQSNYGVFSSYDLVTTGMVLDLHSYKLKQQTWTAVDSCAIESLNVDNIVHIISIVLHYIAFVVVIRSTRWLVWIFTRISCCTGLCRILLQIWYTPFCIPQHHTKYIPSCQLIHKIRSTNTLYEPGSYPIPPYISTVKPPAPALTDSCCSAENKPFPPEPIQPPHTHTPAATPISTRQRR